MSNPNNIYFKLFLNIPEDVILNILKTPERRYSSFDSRENYDQEDDFNYGPDLDFDEREQEEDLNYFPDVDLDQQEGWNF